MKNSQTLAKEETAKREEYKTILAKGEEATEEEIKTATGLVEEITELKAKREEAEKHEQFNADNEAALKDLKTTPVNPVPHAEKADFVGFGEKQAGETVVKDGLITEENGFFLDEKTRAAINSKTYKDNFMKYLRVGKNGLSDRERKEMVSGVDSDGGFLVPSEFLARLIERKPTPTRLFGRVQTLTTSSDKLEMPRTTYNSDDIYSTGIRSTWTGESTTGNEHRTNTPKLGLITIPIHTAMLSCGVTNNQLEDSAFNLIPWLSEKFRETIMLLKDNMIANGNGIGQPQGILLNPGGTDQPATVKSGDANLITADGIIDIAYSVPEQYDENAVFVFNKTNTGKAIAKLKDGDLRYLFNSGPSNDGVASARPTDLVGYPYIYSGFMPNIAANAFPMIFGDLRGYYLAERIGFSLQVLHEIEALDNKKVLVGRVRFGGQVAEPWRLKIKKIAA